MTSRKISSAHVYPRQSGADSGAVLAIQDLSVSYLTGRGEVTAVDSVSLSVGSGEIVGLAGESGSGKSTIAQAILRVLQPPGVIRGGSIVCDGRDVLAMNDQELQEFRWSVASMVFQGAMSALSPVMTVGEAIAEPLRVHRGASRRDALHSAHALLEMVGIPRDVASNYPHQLSGGMRQRVGIAMAISLTPRLLILDEPTTALDVIVQREILQTILDLQRELRFAVLFITHDLALMNQFCDRIAIMYSSQIVEETIVRDPPSRRHPYAEGLLAAMPTINAAGEPLVGIAGTTPNPMSPPSGCRFHPRCPYRMDVCSEREPRLIAVTTKHRVACHLFASEQTIELDSDAND